MIKVSVITTEKNESVNIRKFVESIFSQTYQVDELVICDGGSTDDTVKIVDTFVDQGKPIRLVVKKGNISVGRNEAVKNARNEVIAVTDVGTMADKDWLKNLVAPFEKDKEVHVVGGFFKIAPESFFEEISATQMLADHDEIDEETWLPSSRSIAFTKQAWKKAEGYPEYLPFAGEDTLFDLNPKKVGYKIVFAPKAIVYWRPRTDLRSFFRQYYNYAIGDGLSLVNWPNYFRKILIYIAGLVLLIGGIFNLQIWAILMFFLVLYILRRGRRVLQKYPSPKTLLVSLLVTLSNDIADIAGFIKGMSSR